MPKAISSEYRIWMTGEDLEKIRNVRVWHLNISTYKGLLAFAKHFKGSFEEARCHCFTIPCACPERIKFAVDNNWTEGQIERWTRNYQGGQTDGPTDFLDEKTLVQRALTMFFEMAGTGSKCYFDRWEDEESVLCFKDDGGNMVINYDVAVRHGQATLDLLRKSPFPHVRSGD